MLERLILDGQAQGFLAAAIIHNQSLTPALKTINPDTDCFHEAKRF